MWRAVKPVLETAAADESRFAGVTTLGVDEHVWHHVSTKPIDQGGRGPKEFPRHGRSRPWQAWARPGRHGDLVLGRSGQAYKTWLTARGDTFRTGITVATLDPFHGHKNAIDDGESGLIAELTRLVLESALEAEITDHLGYDKYERGGSTDGNARNGTRAKTVLSKAGPVQVDVPRDRADAY